MPSAPSAGPFVTRRRGRGEVRLVGALAILMLACGGTEPSVSGNRIVFQVFRGDTIRLYSMEADGRDVRRVTDDTLQAASPSWSPDQRRIVFAANPRGQTISNLYLVNGDGTGLRPLLSNGADNREPAWSPDGRRIAFSSFRFDSQGVVTEDLRVWVMQADGSQATPIAPGATPTWSPDSRRLVFVRGLPDDGVATGLFVINSDGTGELPLTDPRPSADQDASPDWSPSGQFIAFTRVRFGNQTAATTWVVRPDGSDLRELNTTMRLAFQPSWSPDESELLASDGDDGQLKAIDVANPASLRLFGSLPGNVNADPDWGSAP